MMLWAAGTAFPEQFLQMRVQHRITGCRPPADGARPASQNNTDFAWFPRRRTIQIEVDKKSMIPGLDCGTENDVSLCVPTRVGIEVDLVDRPVLVAIVMTAKNDRPVLKQNMVDRFSARYNDSGTEYQVGNDFDRVNCLAPSVPRPTDGG